MQLRAMMCLSNLTVKPLYSKADTEAGGGGGDTSKTSLWLF